MTEFQNLLTEFQELKSNESKNPTFLEILSKRDAETLWSRILAFYLNPNKEHGLNDLLLKCLLNVCEFELPDYKIQNVELKIEYKNIDLVIVTNTFIIGIENKVNFWLHNDLEQYYTSLTELAIINGIKSENVKLIVLSKKSEKTDDFKNILYSVYIPEIQKHFFNHFKSANSKYLTFLLDFMENIEKSLNMPIILSNSANFNFYATNYQKINELNIQKNQYVNELYTKLSNIVRLININIDSLNLKHKNRFSIKNVDTPYDGERDYPAEDMSWYMATSVFDNVRNTKFCSLDFSLCKNDPTHLWNFYFKNNSIPAEYNGLFEIPDYTSVQNSLDDEKVSSFFVSILENIISKIM